MAGQATRRQLLADAGLDQTGIERRIRQLLEER